MKQIEIINLFLKIILENKEKLIFGPSDLTDVTEAHFNTAKNFIENFTIFSKTIDKLNDEGIKLIGGKTPKGTPRLMIVPTEEKLREAEELEIKFGFDDKLEIIRQEFKFESPKLNKDILFYKHPEQWQSSGWIYTSLMFHEMEHEGKRLFPIDVAPSIEKSSEKLEKEMEIVVGEAYGR